MRFSCARTIDALARERAHGIITLRHFIHYATCACGVSAKFNTRKMRYTANSQNIVTINNSDLKVSYTTTTTTTVKSRVYYTLKLIRKEERKRI